MNPIVQALNNMQKQIHGVIDPLANTGSTAMIMFAVFGAICIAVPDKFLSGVSEAGKSALVKVGFASIILSVVLALA